MTWMAPAAGGPARRLAAALVLALPLLLQPLGAPRAATDCPEHFTGGQPPLLENPKLEARTREICYAAFAILHSGVTRSALWSAEHLTKESVERAEAMDRKDAFHPEPKLPKAERSELADYTRSGFDRGHLAPSGDMPDEDAQHDSFSLANMIPQDSSLNRGVWAGMEDKVRKLAESEGEVYVVTGPIYAGDSIKSLKGRVLIPTQVWKAVYVPKANRVGVYLAENAPGEQWREVSLLELRRLAGIHPFPSLPDTVTEPPLDLPDPGSKTKRQRRGGGG